LRIALRALPTAIGVPLTLAGRICGICEESVCPRLWELLRCGLLIEDRNEDGKRQSEGPGADETEPARAPSDRLVKCRSDQNRQDEEDEGSDKARNKLPARQPDFPKGPCGGEEERTDIGVETRDPSFDHKVARGEERGADQNVVEASAEQRQVST